MRDSEVPAGAAMTPGSEAMWPEFREIVERDRNSGYRGLETLPVSQAREVMAKALIGWGGPLPPVGLQEVKVAGPACDLPVTVITPRGPVELRPLIVYLHGGGFVLGSVRTHLTMMARLAEASNCVVAAVEYRRAPETPFPGPGSDCATAFTEVSALASQLGADPSHTALVGDSAGATLVVTSCLRLRDDGRTGPSLQVLMYPPVSSSCAGDSWSRYGTGHFLTRSTMRWFWKHYLPRRVREPYAASLLSADLSGLPGALLVLPGLDPLWDEGRALGDRLAHAGVAVDSVIELGAIHGYLGMAGVSPRAADSLTELGSRIGAVLRGSATANTPNSERPS